LIFQHDSISLINIEKIPLIVWPFGPAGMENVHADLYSVYGQALGLSVDQGERLLLQRMLFTVPELCL